MSRTRLAWRIPLLLLAALGCQKSPEPPPSLPVVQSGPRLLLLVAVDQLAFEYLGRFDPFFEGGLRQLMDQGVLFENANYDHALTATAAGHTAMASGLHPASSGIIGNEWYDRGLRSSLYSFEGREHLRSPQNLNGTGLADWLKELDPRSKAFTASAKDRSAIAMGGHAADAAYWFDKETGAFITGSYYTDRPPEWVEDFNRSRLTDRIFGDPWEPLPLTDEELDQLGIVEIDEGLFPRRFPHSIGNQSVAPGGSFYQGIYASPFVDTHLLEFAEALVDAEQLGQREHLDFLALGLSALDSVGHSFGPHSREAADVVLRLDRNLGRFLEFLDARIGLERVVIALTADHGVLPVPEYTSSLGLPGARMGAEDRVCFQRAGRAIAQRFFLEDWVMSGFYLDREMIEGAGADPEEVEAALARELEGCAIVERVWTRAELMNTRMDEPDRMRRLYRHSFHEERSPDLLVQKIPHAISSGSVLATHGSPYEYDTHVPLFFLVPGVPGGRVAEPVRIVDLAPTLAALVGIPTPERLDGRELTSLLEGTAQQAPFLPAYKEQRR